MSKDNPAESMSFGPENSKIKMKDMFKGAALRYNLASCLLVMCFCAILSYTPEQIYAKARHVVDVFNGTVAVSALKMAVVVVTK